MIFGEKAKKKHHEQHRRLPVARDTVRVLGAADRRALSVRVLRVANRPGLVQSAGPVAQTSRRRRARKDLQPDEETQPPGGVGVPGRSVLRVLGQVTRLGVVPGSAGCQLLPPRKR